MQRKSPFVSNRIRYIEAERILRNPYQPRTVFDDNSLIELAASIRRHGILQPLTVRRRDNEWELVAGERRLRAAMLAGLRDVPCIVTGVDDEHSSMLALIENLQRRDLDFVDEAEAIARLIRTFGFTQEQVARELGRSQSSVANKLRVLGHAPEVLMKLRSAGCTERHARALLRLDDAQRVRAAATVVERGLNVADTEALVERMLADKPTGKKRIFILKDVRIFLNTIRGAVDQVRKAGVGAEIGQTELEDGLLVTIKIPK